MTIKNTSVLSILDNLSDACMIIGATGRIIFFNSQAEKITGYSPRDAIGMKCHEIFHSHTCITDCPFHCPNGLNAEPTRRELVITRKDESLLPVECTTAIILDRDGNVTNAVDVFKDISKIKVLEDDLKHLESKYHQLFEANKDMIFILSKNGRFMDLNQAMVDLLGYSEKKELYDLKYIDHIFIDSIHWKVFQKQMTLNGYVSNFETGFKTKEGSRLHCSLSANALRDGQDRIIGYEGIAKDITARMDSFRVLYKSHQELLLLNTIAVTMNSAQNIDPVLNTALNEVMKLLGFSIGAIFLINREKQIFDLEAHKGFTPKSHVDPIDLTFHDLELMQFLLGKDNFLKPKSIFPSFKVRLNNLKRPEFITMTCFLITEKEKPSGFMAFYAEKEDNLAIEDFHLLGSLGNFMGGAIANINLIKTVEEHREELKEITARLFHSQEAECKRISRELHDETGSALIGINLKLDAVEKRISDPETKDLLRHIKGQIDHTYMEMRRISHGLHPALLSDLGLEPALDQYIFEISEQSQLNIVFKMIGFSGRIHHDIETVLYRFSQEALTNTLKYAQAKSFKLSIIKGYPSIIFIADDDGIGFDMNMSHPGRPALGLLSMRERTSLLGGKFVLRTAPGKGTRIRIEIPINPKAASGKECLSSLYSGDLWPANPLK